MTITRHSVRRAVLLTVAAAVLSGVAACTYPSDVLAARRAGGSGASGDPGPSTRRELGAIRWSEVRPGEVILVSGEKPFNQAQHIRRARGVPGQPIVIRAAPGSSPVFQSSIVIEESAHLVLDGLTVRGSKYPGIALKKGSQDVTIKNCNIASNGLGVWLTDGARCGHRIESNDIADNQTHGVAVDGVNCGPGEETIIRGNRVHGNGHHGIEIHGNRYVVEANEVFRNGDRAPGTSGIHLFSRSEQDGTGDHNVIRYNVVYENKEAQGPDGNGIQMDQWCDDNVVSYNVVSANDGAGIIAFDSARDRIYNNTVFGNMLDPDGRHPFKGELVLATDADRRIDRVENVSITNNIVVSTRRGVACIVVDRMTTGRRLEIGNNIFHQKAGGDVFAWGDVSGADPARWSSLSRQAVTDLFADPLLESDHPATLQDFRPRRGSPAVGRAVRIDQTRDASGKAIPTSKRPDIGALEHGGP